MSGPHKTVAEAQEEIQQVVEGVLAAEAVKEVADKLALEQYDTFHKHRLAQEAEQETRADDKEYEKYLTEQAGNGENDFDQAAKQIEAKSKQVKEKQDG